MIEIDFAEIFLRSCKRKKLSFLVFLTVLSSLIYLRLSHVPLAAYEGTLTLQIGRVGDILKLTSTSQILEELIQIRETEFPAHRFHFENNSEAREFGVLDIAIRGPDEAELRKFLNSASQTIVAKHEKLHRDLVNEKQKVLADFDALERKGLMTEEMRLSRFTIQEALTPIKNWPTRILIAPETNPLKSKRSNPLKFLFTATLLSLLCGLTAAIIAEFIPVLLANKN